MVTPRAVPRFCRIALVLALPLTAHAAYASSPSDADLLRGSSLVVDAQVARITPHWNASREVIFTTVDLTISSTVLNKGADVGSSCSFEVLGGEIDGVGLAVSEMPRFARGERVIVFLRPWTEGRLVLTGGVGGVRRVDRSGRIEERAMDAASYVAGLRALAR